MSLRRRNLKRGDVVWLRGMPVSSVASTLGELCARLGLVEAVVLVDAALHRRLVRLKVLAAWADSRAGHHGIPDLRRVIDLAEAAAESPMESRLRMLLVSSGLPRPLAQVPIHDRWGRFAGRPDLYYDSERLGIEYDGGLHRDALAGDDRRQNKLLNAGVRLLRFTAGDVLGHPDSVARQVREMLAIRPAEPASAGENPFRRQKPYPPADAGSGRRL